MAMGCPHQGRSGGLNATITSRPFDSPRPSPGGYETSDQGHFWLDLDRPWDNRSLSGRYLATSELPGIVSLRPPASKGLFASRRAGARSCG